MNNICRGTGKKPDNTDDLGKGSCETCGHWYVLRSDGRMRAHATPVDYDPLWLFDWAYRRLKRALTPAPADDELEFYS